MPFREYWFSLDGGGASGFVAHKKSFGSGGFAEPFSIFGRPSQLACLANGTVKM
jgi:hypothetical protein